MGQGALSKPAVQWWLSLNSSTIEVCSVTPVPNYSPRGSSQTGTGVTLQTLMAANHWARRGILAGFGSAAG